MGGLPSPSSLSSLGCSRPGQVSGPPSPDSSPIKQKKPDMEAPLLDLPKVSFNEALKSFQFVYLVCFCAINILRLNFVVMTLNTQLAVFFGVGSAQPVNS